jgi:peptidoglycan/LPS O-acetylase OafA/YrhL
MVGHARWLLWEGYSAGYLQHPGEYSSLEKMLMYFLSLFSLGHQAVMFFFVLSGFVIHLKYSKKLTDSLSNEFDWKSYFIRRIRRIYPPFLVAIIVTFLLDKIGIYKGYSIYFGLTPNALINKNIKIDHSLLNLIGNLLFLKSEKIDIWGTNGLLWSLKYEWWFYSIYPVLYMINRRNVLHGIWFVVFLFGLGAILPVNLSEFLTSALQSLSCWYLGVILADVYTGRINVSHKAMALFVFVFPAALFVGLVSQKEIVSDLLWSIAFFGLLNLLIFTNDTSSFKIRLKSLKWLGDCSYTLYVVHFPVFVLFNGFLLSRSGNTMPRSFGPFFIGVGLVLIVSYLMHFVTEKPFIVKRK